MAGETAEEKQALENMLLNGDPSGFHPKVDPDSNDDNNANESSEENVEEELEVEGEEEVEEDTFDAKAELLALKQQIATQNQAPVLTQEQQNLIQKGQEIQQLQNTRPDLYNRMIKFAEDDIAGTQPAANSNKIIADKIKELKSHIETYDGKDADTKPFKQMIEVMEMQLEQNQEIMKNNNSTRQALNLKSQELDGYITSSQQEKAQHTADKQLAELAKAEKDFGVKIENGSKKAKQVVALVQGGESVRDAYLLVTGKTEEQKSKKKSSTPITTSEGGKKAPIETPIKQALRKHLFGSTINKKRVEITYDK